MALICQGVPWVRDPSQDRRRTLLDLVLLMASPVCCFEPCIWPNDHPSRGRTFSLEDGGASGLAFAEFKPRAGDRGAVTASVNAFMVKFRGPRADKR